MNMLIENDEEMILTDEQRDYLWNMGYIFGFDDDDDTFTTAKDITMEDIETVLMEAGLTA